ncbi:MAG: hypothetical protein UHH87_00925, partial [Akkermansia sp.]|nr:hypothetical protein [Akkermansia sp.]
MAKDPHRPLDYLVLPVAALRAVTGGLPADTLGILLQLLLRCAVELNSGRIEHAAATTQAPHCNIPGLWHWEGSTLVLDIYPAEYEAKALAKRYNYAANAGERWKKQASIQKEPNAIASPEQCHCIQKTPLLHTPDMQLHQESCNCMQSYMQFPRAHAGDNHNIFNNGGDSAHAHKRESSAPQPAPVVPTTPP